MRRGSLTTVLLLLIALMAVALIGVSPMALRVFHGDTGNWERLSFIGQTYGAASAIVSVLALVGIVLTLSYQAREAKLAREETRRQAVGELLRMAMEDPDLDECWGPVPSPDDPKTRKQLLYTNMIVSEWSLSYGTGALPERRLRVIASEMFHGRVGRAYWRDARGVGCRRRPVVVNGGFTRFWTRSTGGLGLRWTAVASGMAPGVCSAGKGACSGRVPGLSPWCSVGGRVGVGVSVRPPLVRAGAGVRGDEVRRSAA